MITSLISLFEGEGSIMAQNHFTEFVNTLFTSFSIKKSNCLNLIAGVNKQTQYQINYKKLDNTTIVIVPLIYTFEKVMFFQVKIFFDFRMAQSQRTHFRQGYHRRTKARKIKISFFKYNNLFNINFKIILWPCGDGTRLRRQGRQGVDGLCF